MKPTFEIRKPFRGPTRSLVIAIDVGTTFSGVSYAILEPGEVPKIHGVTRFPGQEHVAGNSKIPSILYYDKRGDMRAAGAEVDSGAVQAAAEEEHWVKVELFKLRLRPRTMSLSMNGLRLAPLPPRKSPVHVYGDFLSYLYTCTTNFIKDTHASGADILTAVIPDHIEFVLAHPNGWEGAQQAKMRRAAVYGRLVPDTPEGRARIRFVTEGEASLHACVLSGLAADVLSNSNKHGFLIADAGGGTLDVSSYAIKGTNPLVMEEIAPPDCVFAGSVFVSRRAREFFEVKLKGSQYGTPDSLDHITRQFDEKTKRLFRNKKDTQFVPFGSPFDKDQDYGIRNGQLKLTGPEVASLFEPSIDATFNAIKRQIDACTGTIKSVFLVGGYAASPWLFSELKERLQTLNIVVSRPDTQTSKAVADGAIGFYCDHHVAARMSRFMYGVEYLRQIDPNDPEHLVRQAKLCELPSGPKLLPDAFDCILARGVKVKESTVFTRKYCTELTSLSMLRVFEVEVWCYRGGNVVPKWIERSSETFSTLCVVKADLSMLNGSAAPKQGPNGKTYWTIVFSVEIHFGLTEFQARIKWVQDGQTKYGPATIVYNERGHRTEEDEPDYLPEDEGLTRAGSSRASDRNRLSRSKTPADGHSIESSRRSSRAGDPHIINGSIPEVARAPSTRAPVSTPNTPSRAAHASLEKEDKDRRKISSDSRTKSNRNSVATAGPSVPASPITGGAPSFHHSPRSQYALPSPVLSQKHSAHQSPPPPAVPSVHHSPAKAEPPSLWDNNTPTAFNGGIPPSISRVPSTFSVHVNPSISIFGEDPKSVFGTPGGGAGAADLLGGAGGVDRPVSIFGEDLVGGGGATASVFGDPAGGLGSSKGLWDDPPADGGLIPGGWSPQMSGIRSVASRKSSVKGSPAVSRAPSAQGSSKPLSPLNPASSVHVATIEASGLGAGTLPKIDTNVPPVLTAPAAAVQTPVAETVPATPVSPEVETPTSATTVGGKKKKGGKRATAAAALAAASQRQEEEELRKKEEEEEKRKVQEAEADAKKQEEEDKNRKQEADAEAARLQQEEEEKRKRLEEEQRSKDEEEAKRNEEEEEQKSRDTEEAREEQKLKDAEEAKRKREEEEPKPAKKGGKANKKKEEIDRKKKEDQERKEKERLEQEERDRVALEENKKDEKRKADEENSRLEAAQEEERKKEEEMRLEEERLVEEKKAEDLRLEQEQERQRKEEQEQKRQREEAGRLREVEENLRLEEERISKELEELAEQERQDKEREERESREREKEEKVRQEQARREKEEKARQEQNKGSSLSFGGFFGKKTTSLASSLFGAVSPDPPQDPKDNASGWNFNELKKKTSKASLARSTIGPSLSKKPSRIFDQWGSGNGSTTDVGIPPTNPTTSVFGTGGAFGTFDTIALQDIHPAGNLVDKLPEINTNADSLFGNADFDSFGMQGLNFNNTPANEPTSTSPAPTPVPPPVPTPIPPPKEEDQDSAWGFTDFKSKKKSGKNSQQPTRATSPVQSLVQSPVDEKADAFDDTWGVPLKGKKKGRKGRIDGLLGSEEPSRAASPALGGEDGAIPTSAAEDDMDPLQTKQKKKNIKKGKNNTEEFGEQLATDDGADQLNDELADLLGADGSEGKDEQIADVADEFPVKGKKGKKGKKGANDAGTDTPAPGASGETQDEGLHPAAKKKKKSAKK